MRAMIFQELPGRRMVFTYLVRRVDAPTCLAKAAVWVPSPSSGLGESPLPGSGAAWVFLRAIFSVHGEGVRRQRKASDASWVQEVAALPGRRSVISGAGAEGGGRVTWCL